MIGALIEIVGAGRAGVISRFPVGFQPNGSSEREMKMVHYYEIYSMGKDNGKRRRTIDLESFQDAIQQGNIKVLSRPRES